MSGSKIRIGILGGTFDPIHNGHLRIAHEAQGMLNLTRVIFMPAPYPWMKMAHRLTNPDHRYRMVELAMKRNSCFSASRMEMDHPAPTYTIATLRQFISESEGNNEVFFILGSDAYMGFHLWKEAAQILKLCTLVVAPRGLSPNLRPDDENNMGRESRAKIIQMKKPLVDISSTGIRQRVADGMSILDYVPYGVEEYICQNGLYKGETPTWNR